ncbi:MAG: hypothetical protein OCC45_14725 [Desulfotalea sp.]
MSEISELQKLEEFVGKLLAEYNKAKEELVIAKKQVDEQKLVIEELNDQVSMQQLESEDVTERVNRIVEQFESWERDLAEEELMEETSQKEQEEVVPAPGYTANSGSSY